MKKNNKFLFVIVSIFVLIASITTFVSFSSNVDVQEVVVKSITPVYDENSTVVVDNNNVVFNDKNQVVEYKVVIENTQSYDVRVDEFFLSSPSEEFLEYTIKNIENDETIKANSTKEFILSLETTGIKGWGRNFSDELVATVGFDKVTKNEDVKPPVKHPEKDEEKEEVKPPKEEVKLPEKPAQTIQEVINKTEKIEAVKITKDTIEFKDEVKVEKGQKVAVWIYSDPIFLGYFDVIETNGIKQIVGLEEALKEADIESGEHHIVLTTEENETIGYVEVYVDEKQEVSQDKLTTEDDGKVENPYTSDKGLIIVLCIATCSIGVLIKIVSKNKFTKYTVFILMMSPVLTITNAESPIELSINNSVSFESQNVMKSSYFVDEAGKNVFRDYWFYREKIKNFYILNELREIPEYVYKFDVTQDNNGRVTAYLVINKDDSNYYDLYLIADGIIYSNSDSSAYFYQMKHLDKLENLAGLDTSMANNMRLMFSHTGYDSEIFELDVSSLNTGNVTNMRAMFQFTGYSNSNFTLDVSNFDTSNVIDMSYMFNQTGNESKLLELDVSGFDTSQVTDMRAMFQKTGHNNPNFVLDVSNFDTSNVTDMGFMFYLSGYESKLLELDVSGFDTSNLISAELMFYYAGFNNPNFTLDVSGFDTSKVANMRGMFRAAGYNSPEFTLDVSNFDTSNVTDMSYMFADSGYNSLVFNVDVSNFDTSNLISAEGMFYNTGFNSTKLNTSITIKNYNTNVMFMFLSTAIKDGTCIKVNYTNKTEGVVNRAVATKTEKSNVEKGTMVESVDFDLFAIGSEITINGEHFNVIEQSDDTVTLFAQLNLGTDYRQSLTYNKVLFSDVTGWEHTPGPKEIDIQTWSTNPKVYIKEYVDFLKESLGTEEIYGDLITLKQLESLGCSIPKQYEWTSDESKRSCANSPYRGWIFNNQKVWTKSTSSGSSGSIWIIYADYLFSYNQISAERGIRPVITVSKMALENYLKTS